MVHFQYCLDSTKGVRVSEYILILKERTLDLLTGCARTIADDPAKACPQARSVHSINEFL